MMNPDKLLQHEYDRIGEMTDKQLSARYKKMTKPEKIEAFGKALKKTDRHRELQRTIDKARMKVGVIEWVLLKDDFSTSYRFVTKPNNPKEIAIFCTKATSQEDRFMPHCDIDKARDVWNSLIKEGYECQ